MAFWERVGRTRESGLVRERESRYSLNDDEDVGDEDDEPL